MRMLNPDIRLFIERINIMGAVGCLRVPKSSKPALMDVLSRADVLVGKNPMPGRAMLFSIESSNDLRAVSGPAIVVVSEEDYDDAEFSNQVRRVAEYFMQVL